MSSIKFINIVYNKENYTNIELPYIQGRGLVERVKITALVMVVVLAICQGKKF
jgi:uncharacterized membrane protein YbaN (DUF454 family)